MQQEGEKVVKDPSIKSQLDINEEANMPDEWEPESQGLFDQNYTFFLHYSKLYEANSLLKIELQNLIREKLQLKQYISKIEVYMLYFTLNLEKKR